MGYGGGVEGCLLVCLQLNQTAVYYLGLNIPQGGLSGSFVPNIVIKHLLLLN